MYTIQTFTSNNEQLNMFPNPEETMTYMTFVEEPEKPEDKTSKMSLWVNSRGRVFFEVQPDGNENDYYEYQCLSLSKDDVLKLISELQRLVSEYELS